VVKIRTECGHTLERGGQLVGWNWDPSGLSKPEGLCGLGDRVWSWDWYSVGLRLVQSVVTAWARGGQVILGSSLPGLSKPAGVCGSGVGTECGLEIGHGVWSHLGQGALSWSEDHLQDCQSLKG